MSSPETSVSALPSEYLYSTGGNPDLEPSGLVVRTEHVKPRLERAHQMQVEALPYAQGMYRVKSSSPDAEPHVVNLDGVGDDGGRRAVCLCPDFMFSAAQLDIDCAHIIYVKRLVAEGYLPPIEADQRPWMENRIGLLVDSLPEDVGPPETVQEAMAEPMDADLRLVEAEVTTAGGDSLADLV